MRSPSPKQPKQNTLEVWFKTQSACFASTCFAKHKALSSNPNPNNNKKKDRKGLGEWLLLSKYRALSLNLSTPIKKKKKWRE
jgi:hypothetical protein